MKSREEQFMQMAVRLSREGMEAGSGGPFGAIVVKDDEVIGQGCNSVLSGNDPTAHAEIVAIREACKKLGSFALEGCEIYTSCEPCPMCLGAIYWSHIDKIFYANTRHQAEQTGFDDSLIYKEISLPIDEREIPMQRLNMPEALEIFRKWEKKEDKTAY